METDPILSLRSGDIPAAPKTNQCALALLNHFFQVCPRRPPVSAVERGQHSDYFSSNVNYFLSLFSQLGRHIGLGSVLMKKQGYFSLQS